MVKLFKRLLIVLYAYVLCLGMTAFANVKSDFLSSNSNASDWEVGFWDDDGQGIAGWCLDNCPGSEVGITMNYTDQPIAGYGVYWEPGGARLMDDMFTRNSADETGGISASVDTAKEAM
ncbi:MAG: hypothetical protein ABFD49_05405 [Armatimonadota bacterium]|nr:hypothetical protein [bacterium]